LVDDDWQVVEEVTVVVNKTVTVPKLRSLLQLKPLTLTS
jgi:hypothetical protein